MRFRACAVVLACALASVSRASADEPVVSAEPAETPPVADKPIVVWPTQIPEPETDREKRPSSTFDRDDGLQERASELDATIRDAVQDLGFALDVADPGPAVGRARDIDMV